MKRIRIIPRDLGHWLELRKHDVTSSEVAALFGLSPYMTVYQLWQQKCGNLADKEIDNERVRHGIRMERAIADTVLAETMPDRLEVVDLQEYIRLDELRVGSSFDFAMGSALIEVKNVDGFIYHRDWIKGEAPPHIELQVQHQMLVSGYKECHICALVGGNKAVRIHREANSSLHEAILSKCQLFWLSVDSGREPHPDLQKDARALISLQKGRALKNRVMFPDDEVRCLAREYSKVTKEIGIMKKRQESIRSNIYVRAQDASLIAGDGLEIQLNPFRVKWRSR